jgi:hypothetical protein
MVLNTLCHSIARKTIVEIAIVLHHSSAWTSQPGILTGPPGQMITTPVAITLLTDCGTHDPDKPAATANLKRARTLHEQGF